MRNYALVMLAATLMLGGMWLTAPSEEDIQLCVDTSNWSYDRCKFELSR